MTQPNILLIMPDEMRGDCMSLTNYPTLATPIIDSIGYVGTNFSRAYSTCPSCIAARRPEGFVKDGMLVSGRPYPPKLSRLVMEGGGENAL